MGPVSRFLVALAFVGAALAGCVTPAAVLPADADLPVPGVDADGFAPRVFEEGFAFGTLTIPVDATLRVHAETYLPLVEKPLAADAPAKFPTVLVMSPYFGAGQNGEAPGHPVYGWLVRELVPRGYAVVLADVAGTGGSSGCWDFMGPNEVRSVAAMIDGIAAQSWSDGKVGMIGKSYDGMTQVMATATNPEALKTIVPVAPLSHAYAGLYMNGIHYGGGWRATTTGYHLISATPPVGAEERYPGYVVRTIETPPCLAQNTLLGNDPSGSYNLYFRERDFRPAAAGAAPSVFYMQGFLDGAVKPDNMIGWFDALPGPKKAWIGHWAHDYANATWAGRTDMFPTLHRWFDHELKGIPNGILDEPFLDVQDSQGRWRHEASWPPADAQTLTLHVSEDVTLSPEPGERAGSLSFGGPAAVAGDDAIVIPSADVVEPVHIAGSPRLTLALTPDRAGAYVVAQLLVVNDSGERLVSRGAMNLQFLDGLDAPAPLVPMQEVVATFDLYPTDFAMVPGDRLALRLETVDDTVWFDPDPFGATLRLAAGGGASFLELPVIERGEDAFFLTACGARVKAHTPWCFDETRRDEGVDA